MEPTRGEYFPSDVGANDSDRFPVSARVPVYAAATARSLQGLFFKRRNFVLAYINN